MNVIRSRRILSRKLSTAKVYVCHERARGLDNVKLTCRDYIDVKNLTGIEIKSILWTALDIQYLLKRSQLKLKELEGARVTLILNKPCMKSHLALSNAAKLLNIQVNTIIDDDGLKNTDCADYGRMAATYSNIIFTKIPNQKAVESLADGANCPLIAIDSDAFNLVQNLADLLTIYKYYNKLKGVTVSFIGTSGNMFNTYLCTLPLLHMNFKYFLFNGNIDDETLCSCIKTGWKLSQINKTEIHECSNIKDVLFRTNVIKTVGHSCPKYQVSLNDLKDADNKWILLHDLPRGTCELEHLLFYHQNSLIWKSLKNMELIYAALIVRFLTEYYPVTKEPNFDTDILECL